MAQEFKYTAFISYNSKDNRKARWLQKRLESYNLPSVIVNEKGEVIRSYDNKSNKFRIFRYVTDLVAQNLNDGLRQELDQSKYLIVICSPNSVYAPWVRKEVKHFIDTGRKKQIIPFVIKGIPYSGGKDECFTPELKEAFPDGSVLGVSLNDYGDGLWIFRKRKAVAKMVSLLIDLPNVYDFIWNRYRANYIKTLILRAILTLLVAISILMAVYLTQRKEKPFNMHVQLTEDAKYPKLPPIHDIEVVATIGNGKPQKDTIQSLGHEAVFSIAGRQKGQPMRLTVRNVDCKLIDTIINVQDIINLPLCRKPDRYGHIQIVVFINDEPLRNAIVNIEGKKYKTSKDGVLTVDMPLNQQKQSYQIEYNNFRESISMPCEGTRCLILNK